MSSTQSHSPAASYPLSFQSAGASLPSFFARRPLFSIACSLFSENTRGGGSLPTYEPSFTHAKSIPSYHLHVNQAISTNYALFCATGIRHLPCFQHLPHSFVVDRGWYPPVHTVSTPASPSCFEPGLPIHTTLHRTALSGIHDQTGNSHLVSFEVDNQAGALLRSNPPQAAALRDRKCGHLRPSRTGLKINTPRRVGGQVIFAVRKRGHEAFPQSSARESSVEGGTQNGWRFRKLRKRKILAACIVCPSLRITFLWTWI